MGANEVTLAEQQIITDTQVTPVEGVFLPFPSATDAVQTVDALRLYSYSLMGLMDAPAQMIGMGSSASGMLWCTHGGSTQLRQTSTPFDVADFLIGITTTPMPSRWGDYVLDRLAQIEQRAVNKTNEGPYPSAATVERARLVAGQLFSARTPTPSVVPSEDGGVSFVWHKGGLDIDIEVGDDEVFVCVYRRASGDSFYGSLNEHSGRVQAVLQYLALIP